MRGYKDRGEGRGRKQGCTRRDNNSKERRQG